MRRLIVTHYNPDLDAICAAWLLRRFCKDFSEAKVAFVPAGETYKNMPVDSDPRVIHVDTGLGRFDHHQLDKRTCSAILIFDFLRLKNKDLKKNSALVRLVKVVCEVDHFGECFWSEPMADWHNFDLIHTLNGLKISGVLDDEGLIDFGSNCLEGVYTSLKVKVRAEEDLAEGTRFRCKWGKAIGCLTSNNGVLKLGQRMGYVLVIQKDPATECVRIKVRPDTKADLTQTLEVLKELDPLATWFLHRNKKMLLNGSVKNPKMKASGLSLRKIIEVLKEAD